MKIIRDIFKRYGKVSLLACSLKILNYEIIFSTTIPRTAFLVLPRLYLEKGP